MARLITSALPTRQREAQTDCPTSDGDGGDWVDPPPPKFGVQSSTGKRDEGKDRTHGREPTICVECMAGDAPGDLTLAGSENRQYYD